MANDMRLAPAHFRQTPGFLEDTLITWNVYEEYQQEIRNEPRGDQIKLIRGRGERTSQRESDYHGSLFLEFARLGKEPTVSRVLRFVRTYGLLTFPPRESLADIQKEARKAYQLLTLYEALLNKDLDQLRDRVEFIPGDGWALDPEIVKLAVESTGHYEAYSVLVDGDKLNRRHFLPEALDTEIACFVYIAEETVKRLEEVECNFRGVRRQDPWQFTEAKQAPFHITPAWECKTLLSFIYLQFYFVVANMRPIRRCVVCGTDISHKRLDAQTCSNTCRQKKNYWESRNC